MAGKLARRTQNLIRKTVGTIGKLPRLHIVDTDTDVYGYIDVNANATTPFSRGKVHKGIFCCSLEDIGDGALVYDRADAKYYFLMDGKTKVYNGEAVYVDGTMYRCDSIIDVQRFVGGLRDGFGRSMDVAPITFVTGVYAMFNPLNFDIKEQQDRLVAENKIKVCVQSSVGIQVADRIITQDGSKYNVTSVDSVSLSKLVLCTVDTDVR